MRYTNVSLRHATLRKSTVLIVKRASDLHHIVGLCTSKCVSPRRINNLKFHICVHQEQIVELVCAMLGGKEGGIARLREILELTMRKRAWNADSREEILDQIRRPIGTAGIGNDSAGNMGDSRLKGADDTVRLIADYHIQAKAHRKAPRGNGPREYQPSN